MSDPKNMHVLDSDIALAAALVVAIAIHYPNPSPETLGDLAPIIAADVSYWRRRRTPGFSLGRLTPSIAERRDLANRELYALYKGCDRVPRIVHGTGPGDEPYPYVDSISALLADDIYYKLEVEKLPPGRPRKFTVGEIANMAPLAKNAAERKRVNALKPIDEKVASRKFTYEGKSDA